MTGLPHVDSARRFFLDARTFLDTKTFLDGKSGLQGPTRSAYAAIAIAFGLTISCSSTFAQNAAKGSPDHIKAVTSAVDSASIKANTATSNDWPTIGLDYAETRFSKLNQITADNVKDLGLMWSYSLDSSRGVEATPVVVDGIMYQTASWSVVHAIDARTGKKIWTFDPGVDREKGYKGCCDVVNRGVALYKGKVFVGAYDGRLIALDAATGQKVWEKDTITDHSHSYTITGAPRVFNGKVVIGNGGAEYGVRGYITAYDADTGNQAWRWFTVPGDPSKPFEDDSMAAAAKTWDPAGKWWINGGGGTAWDSITFDPDLNIIYIGTGNGAPWNRNLRSPAGGDNLYLASIVALNADTGKYVWHYQETPGDSWDYTSSQPMILADINIDGAPRKVILHAPKNGFFFVIDRTNGKFISAKNFVDVNWATGYDANGRPIEVAEARGDKPFDSIPGAYGAHNWHPMSFNPQTGFVYIPAQNVPVNLTGDKDWTHNSNNPGQPHSGLGWNLGYFANVEPPKSQPFGRLIAWDPVKQQQVWKQDYVSPWNGGTLTICLGRGRLGRCLRRGRAGDRHGRAGDGLYLRCRRQGAAAKLHEVPDGGLARRRKVRSRQCRGRHAALCEQLRVLSWRARRRQGRQHQESRLRPGRNDREPEGLCLQGPVQGSGHAGLHRQAERRGRGEDPGLHSGHGGRNKAEEGLI
jgi:quinohemoprotein ethanol dehydrogenase